MYERQSKWRYSNNLDLFSPKMLSWELTEYSLPLETSLEADFNLGGHPNEVGGLFLQYMFERQTNWRYPINFHQFEPKMRSPGVRDHAMRRSNRSFGWKMRSPGVRDHAMRFGGWFWPWRSSKWGRRTFSLKYVWEAYQLKISYQFAPLWTKNEVTRC